MLKASEAKEKSEAVIAEAERRKQAIQVNLLAKKNKKLREQLPKILKEAEKRVLKASSEGKFEAVVISFNSSDGEYTETAKRPITRTDLIYDADRELLEEFEKLGYKVEIVIGNAPQASGKWDNVVLKWN